MAIRAKKKRREKRKNAPTVSRIIAERGNRKIAFERPMRRRSEMCSSESSHKDGGP